MGIGHEVRFEDCAMALRFSGEAVVRTDAGERTIAAGAGDGSVHTRYEVIREDGRVRILFSLRNASDAPVEVLRMLSLRLEKEEDLDTGVPYGRTRVMLQMRHKNDIPSVVTLGQWDEAMMDAASGMTEAGQQAGGSRKAEIAADTLAVIEGREGYLAVAFPGGDRFFCSIHFSLGGQRPAVWAGSEPGITLHPGQEVQAEEIELRAGSDWRKLVRDYAADKAVRLGSRKGRLKVPAVFCTWYYYGLTVSLEDVRENLRAIREMRLPYDVFQLDEGWEVTLGEWRPNSRFPVSMEALAGEIRAAGLVPGLWTSPFIAHETASVWQAHPEWRLCGQDGKPVLFPMNDTVYQVLDITLPAVRDEIRAFYRRVTEQWGYTYHKLDFTRAAVLYPGARRGDPSLAWPEAYRLAMRAVREGIGEESFLLVCGGLYDAAAGLADAQRTGSDVLSMWVARGTGGKAVPFTVKQNLMRTYMGAWWANDADCLMLRRRETMERGLNLTLGLLTDSEVRTVLANQYVSGGLLSQTEPLAETDSDRLAGLRRLLPLFPLEAEADCFDGRRIPSRVRVRGENLTELVLFNWDDEASLPVSLSPEDVTGEEAGGGTYLLSACYSGRYGLTKAGERVELGEVAPHAAEIVRVQAWDGTGPAVVGTTGHFAMGAELVALTQEGDTVTAVPGSPLPFTVTYTVLLAGGAGVRRCTVEGTARLP